MTEDDAKAIDDAYAEGGLVAAAGVAFERWCRHWHEAHPDLDPDLLELIDLYAEDRRP